MSVRMRQYVERQIIGALVRDLLTAGYSISVWNGEDFEVQCADTYGAVIKALDTTDEDRLDIHHAKGAAIGWVQLIYGNSGPDVISDYTTNLEPYMKNAQALSDYWDADGPFVSPPAAMSC